VEDDKETVSVRFRGVKKDKSIIPIENIMCHIYYNNKTAYLSSYSLIERHLDEVNIPKLIITNEGKKIVLDYNPTIVKNLEDNNIQFKIYNHCSYREED
ncbi:MAG: hypothetical protein KGD58_18365, partial [Candidatus Lokiarchaeota archaeon]|nr:hypothetical protein [Candidatus Lokiarchaeota archaeon]